MKSSKMSDEMRASLAKAPKAEAPAEASEASEAPTADLEEQVFEVDVENLIQTHVDIYKEVAALLDGYSDSVAAILTASIMLDVRAAVRMMDEGCRRR